MSRAGKKGGGGSGQGGGKGGLSAEDRALWERFAKAVTPSNTKPRVADTAPGAGLNRDSRETIPPKSGKSSKKSDMKSGPLRPPAVARKEPSAASAPDLDRNLAKKLGRGRAEIDARIDLHGMRQHEAHDALRRFLSGAVVKGYRNVLVITGKGRAEDEGSSWTFDPDRPARGVLRRSVPLWLAEPEFRDLVAGFTTAHFRHGGEGAFYVQVRRPKSMKPKRR
jgi:DNA-nicking Smr family endonuclease